MGILTQARLKELLDYDLSSGKFRWRKRSGSRAVPGAVAGCHQPQGYIRLSVDGQLQYAHRLAFLYVLGRFPAEQVDHINQDKLDNRWINLRPVSQCDNAKNMKQHSTNKSGITGVRRSVTSGKYVADIYRDGKSLHLGTFSTIEEAADARSAASVRYGFHQNHGRPIVNKTPSNLYSRGEK